MLQLVDFHLLNADLGLHLFNQELIGNALTPDQVSLFLPFESLNAVEEVVEADETDSVLDLDVLHLLLFLAVDELGQTLSEGAGH